MRLIDFDGTGGNQDRSLAAEAVIFPGSITIVKAATPEGSTSFPFTASPSPLSNFSLVDDGTSANTKLFNNITNFTNYTVTETVPDGWTLDGISCTVTSPNGGSQTPSGSTVTINLKEGEDVTCTFTDTQQKGSLAWEKRDHLNALQGGATFVVSPDPLDGDGTLTVVDNGANDADPDAGQLLVNNVLQAAYTITETVPPARYAGTASLTVVDNDASDADADAGQIELSPVLLAAYTITETVSPAGYALDDDPIRLQSVTSGDLNAVVGTQGTDQAGDTDESDFHNRRLPRLKLVKDLVPDTDTGKFDLNDGATVRVDEGGDGATSGFYNTTTGTHSLSELAGSTSPTVLSNYTSTLACVDAANNPVTVTNNTGTSGDVTLAYGDEVTCTFTNTKRGTLIIQKVSVGGVGTFEFTGSGPGPSLLSIPAITTSEVGTENVGSQTLPSLVPGFYGVAETVQTGWLLTNTNCASSIVGVADTDNAGSLELHAGETITCTFTNTLAAHFGKTMGFWGNKNGNDRLDMTGPTGVPDGMVDAPATLGVVGTRSKFVDEIVENNKIGPAQLNACGMGCRRPPGCLPYRRGSC